MSPFVKNISLGAGGLVVAIAIYVAGSVTGANYGSAILDHLEDIVQGSTTRTVNSLNAPNWGIGTPLSAPFTSRISTSTGGSLGSGTTLSFEVAALDGEGTTTLSSAARITTNAGSLAINLSWSAVAGAQGYAIYVSTSTPDSYSVYWLATSTNGVPNTSFTLTSTTTNVLAGSYTRSTSTAFSNRLMADGSKSWLNAGPVGVGTSSPASSTPMDINGAVRAQSIGTSTNCYAATAGDVFYNTANGHEWGCNGSAWQKIF